MNQGGEGQDSKGRARFWAEIGSLVFAFAASMFAVMEREAPLPFGANRMEVLIALGIGMLVALTSAVNRRAGDRGFPLSWLIWATAAVALVALLWLVMGW